jgi:hypothetical protein
LATYLEHANITVPDIDAAITFLKVIDPRFEVRRDEICAAGYRWAHIGSGTTYIALQAPHADSDPQSPLQTYKNFGVNHLAWVVDVFDAAIQRLEESGYSKGIPVETEKHRKRAYYFDFAGFEWEIVEYLSDLPAERNS